MSSLQNHSLVFLPHSWDSERLRHVITQPTRNGVRSSIHQDQCSCNDVRVCRLPGQPHSPGWKWGIKKVSGDGARVPTAPECLTPRYQQLWILRFYSTSGCSGALWVKRLWIWMNPDCISLYTSSLLSPTSHGAKLINAPQSWTCTKKGKRGG